MEKTSEENKIIELKFSLENNWKWMAKDEDGSVTVFNKKPNLIDGVWDSLGEFKVLTHPNSGSLLANYEDSLIPI